MSVRIVALLDTSVASLNKGDGIIMDAVHREMDSAFEHDFVIDMPTHTVSFPPLKSFMWSRAKAISSASIKLIGGTDIFWPNMLMRPNPLFNISFLNYRPFKGSIFCGVGMNSKKGSKKLNFYSKALWKRVLSRDYIHSTRDEATKEALESMGFKAINTGCPTMWGLTSEHCATIRHEKAPSVVTALSDKRNPEADKGLLELLLKQYETVYFWPQGHHDYEYLVSLGLSDKVEVVNPSVSGYRSLLQTHDLDYVGPRLHAGVFALQHAKRSLILGVDHRAQTFAQEVGLPFEHRTNFEGIERWIMQPYTTDIHMDFDAINAWKAQFER